ncbi:uncharacterized protein FMAN_06946 [Fusarium mangiferae]|uniref:Uncharacterized protein n=1 Tax=Fusarium mangiferae TaxID=192010 RepID=A0A1L7T8H5_FUSMA|nr:uncharacterized protein FMAN_06946 [Fusarium mangiferae]CVK91855.1 uncharacterized protein FMAN_06946 [Fusarium mangiferae]
MNLISFHSILLFVSACLAADAQVAWRLERNTKVSSLVARDTNGTVIAETCSSTIYAKHPIDFSNVDEIDGSGNFTVGNATYMVHSNPDWSGGPACSRTFNPQYILVLCSGVSWDAADAVGDKPRACFTESPTNGELQFLQNKTLNDASQMHKRGWWDKFKNKMRDAFSTTERELDGDGNPRQHYFHQQISEPIRCGNSQGCTVGKTDSESFSVGATFSNETVCIWYNTAHTTYTVKDTTRAPGEYKKTTSIYDISSPNKNNKGGDYYCVVGHCKAKGDSWWDRNGRRGGP